MNAHRHASALPPNVVGARSPYPTVVPATHTETHDKQREGERVRGWEGGEIEGKCERRR